MDQFWPILANFGQFWPILGDLGLPTQLINLMVEYKCQVLHSNCLQSFCNGSMDHGSMDRWINGSMDILDLPAQLINLTVGSKCQVLHSNCLQSFCNGSIWTSVEFVRDFEGFPGSFEFLGPARSAEALPDPLLVEEPPILAFSICSCFSRSCWALPICKKTLQIWITITIILILVFIRKDYKY